MRKHKYNAKPTIVDGIRFASKREAQRYGELKLLEKAGVIFGLKLQPRFVLQEKNGKDRAIVYVADFRYIERVGGPVIIEDVKGVQTQAFKIKAKLFRRKFPMYILRIVK